MHSESDTDPLKIIFAYRAFDLRDHFPEPFENFRQALESLQSSRACMPEFDSCIVAYVKGGGSIKIPGSFYIQRVHGEDEMISSEQNNKVCIEVEAWLRHEIIKLKYGS